MLIQKGPAHCVWDANTAIGMRFLSGDISESPIYLASMMYSKKNKIICSEEIGNELYNNI